MSVTPEEVETIRGIWGTVLARDWEAARDWALQRLREDIVDPTLVDLPDGYVYRANAVTLGLMGAGLWGLAEDIYERLIAQVDAYAKSTGTRRHRGALLANQAVCQILSGKFDVGVPRLIYTADVEDWETFGPPISVTPAMAHLRNLFELPAQRVLIGWSTHNWLKAYGLPPTIEQATDIGSLLGSTRWSLYSSILRTEEIWRTHRDFPSSYAMPRLVDGIRGICACLEHLAKSIGKRSAVAEVRQKFVNDERVTLHKCYVWLFGDLAPAWWSRVSEARAKGLTDFNAKSSWHDFLNKLEKLQTWPVSTGDDLTARTLAVALLCRNYSAHETEAPADFADITSERPPFVDMVTACSTAFFVLAESALLLGHLPDLEGASYEGTGEFTTTGNTAST